MTEFAAQSGLLSLHPASLGGPALNPLSERSAVSGHRRTREAKANSGLTYACLVVSTPLSHLYRISRLGPTETSLAVVSSPCRCQRCARSGTSILTALDDSASLHVCHLGQHGDHDLPDASAYGSKAMHMDHYAHVDQPANSRLNVERVPAQPIDRSDMKGVVFSNELQQLREARAISGQDKSAHVAVLELLIEIAA